MADCVVIGAGLVGMLSALELSRAGMKVRLLEKGQAGKESTWAGGGILSPLYPWRYADAVSQLANWSQAHYPDLCEELRDQSGIDPQYTRSGLLIADPGDIQPVTDWADRFDMKVDIVGPTECRQFEPELGLDPHTAVWLPGIAQVRNPRLAQALVRTLENRGVEISTGAEVTGLEISADRVSAVNTSCESVYADNFVIAAGAWTGRLMQGSGLHLPIVPVRGQMILFRGPPGLVSRITLSENRYVIPRRDGRVLVGSTLEHTGFEKQTTETARSELLQAAIRIIPALESIDIEHHWAGLRPGSPEGIPVIGPHPGFGNLYINAGHFRNGVVLGPASVRVLADSLLERAPALPAEPYLPENFS